MIHVKGLDIKTHSNGIFKKKKSVEWIFSVNNVKYNLLFEYFSYSSDKNIFINKS